MRRARTIGGDDSIPSPKPISERVLEFTLPLGGRAVLARVYGVAVEQIGNGKNQALSMRCVTLRLHSPRMLVVLHQFLGIVV